MGHFPTCMWDALKVSFNLSLALEWGRKPGLPLEMAEPLLREVVVVGWSVWVCCSSWWRRQSAERVWGSIVPLRSVRRVFVRIFIVWKVISY